MGVVVFGHLLFIVVAIPLALIDLKTHRLPDTLTLPLWAASAGVAFATIPDSGWELAISSCVASALSVLFLWLLAECPGRPLGFGDVKLGGIIGIQLGIYGVDCALTTVAFSFVVGGLAGLWLVVTGQRRARDHISFGPAMVVAAIIGLLFTSL